MRRNGLGARLMAALTIATWPVAASATTFKLDYTTFADGVNAPVTVDAVLTASADPYTPGGFLVSGIRGTRGGVSISGIADPFSEIYVPAAVLPGYSFATYLDSFGLTFSAGGQDYQLYRGASDTAFYHELENPNGIGTGRLIQPAAFSLSVQSGVPEPAGWATMAIGLGVAGSAVRRRRRPARAGFRAA